MKKKKREAKYSQKNKNGVQEEENDVDKQSQASKMSRYSFYNKNKRYADKTDETIS